MSKFSDSKNCNFCLKRLILGEIALSEIDSESVSHVYRDRTRVSRKFALIYVIVYVHCDRVEVPALYVH